MRLTAAQQLSQWLENTHPALFAALHQRANQLQQAKSLRNARLMGFGDDGSGLDFSLPDTSSTDFSSVVPAGSFDAADTITVTGGDVSTPLDVSAPIEIPTVSASDLTSPGVSSAFSPSSDVTSAGSGFLQTIGSGIASAASSVGNFLTSPQGLNDLTKLGTAYFQLQNNKTNAQLQTAVLNAQVARIQSGGSPYPITYARAANGTMVPVYQSSSLASQGIYPSNMPVALQAAISAGQSQLVTLPDGSTGYTVSPHLVGGLSISSTSSLLPWIALIGLGLLLARG